MENQNQSVVYIHSSGVVLNLNIILPFYLPLFLNLFISSSYYKFASLFHSMHIFSYTKKSSLSLSLKNFFILCWIYYYYFSCISTLD